MDQLIAKIEAKGLRQNLPDFRVGDIVKVHQRIREGGKERIQIFEGIVIAKKHGAGMGGTFTVRRIASGVGVERVYPLHSPTIAKIERTRQSKVRRAKLYFLRELFGKKAKLKGWEAYASWSEDAAAPESLSSVEGEEGSEVTTEDNDQVAEAETDNKDDNTLESEVVETPEATEAAPATEENSVNDQAAEGNGKSGGAAGGEIAEAEGSSDTPAKS